MTAKLSLATFRAANKRSGGPCCLSAFLKTLSRAEVAEVYKAIADRSIQAAAIHRVLTRRGWKNNEQVISRHRTRGCATCGIRV